MISWISGLLPMGKARPGFSTSIYLEGSPLGVARWYFEHEPSFIFDARFERRFFRLRMFVFPGPDVNAPALAVEQPRVHVVKGHARVRPLAEFLRRFGERCGQPGAMQDLGFFLSKPGAMARMPHLLLVSRGKQFDADDPKLEELLGVLLIFEYRAMGKATGGFATNDRSGRSTFLALPGLEQQVLALAVGALVKCKARVILVSYRNESRVGGAALRALDHPPLQVEAGGPSVARWATRERTIPGYLPLEITFDATLAHIGQRTRSNLRYYRRRAEKQLGCTFLPEINITREELMEFNKQCMYAVPASVAGWRYDSLKELSVPLLMGLKDGQGRWLSMLGGRRYGGRSEILWQLNRDGFAIESLSTVMRSYFIEHEIGQGSTRLYIEGGTPQPIRFSFVQETLIDLAVVRRSALGRMMARLARYYISPDNELANMLDVRDLIWREC
jgi:hypothetical protein